MCYPSEAGGGSPFSASPPLTSCEGKVSILGQPVLTIQRPWYVELT